ncbi:MAG TPA: hypothetical protein VGM39_09445 [Kofleriaceae bacterium]
MKPTKLLLVLAVMLMPALASAQGYYGRRHGGPGPGYYNTTPPTYQLPGGFWNRQGRIIFGANLGIGHMKDDFGDITCDQCDYSTVSGMAAAHIGGFVSERFALMGEVQANVQTVSSDAYSGDTTNLVESAIMIAGQYWLTPQLWIKGGIGFANLHLERSYYGDGVVDEESPGENGTALMGALGYEIYSSRSLAIDLEGRLFNGSFKGVDNNVTSMNLGLGISFF